MIQVDRFIALAQGELEANGQLVAKSYVEALRAAGLQFEAFRSLMEAVVSLSGASMGTAERQTSLHAAGSVLQTAGSVLQTAGSVRQTAGSVQQTVEAPWQAALEIAQASARLAAALGIAAADVMSAWSRAYTLVATEAVAAAQRQVGAEPAVDHSGPVGSLCAISSARGYETAARESAHGERVHWEDFRQTANPIIVE